MCNALHANYNEWNRFSYSVFFYIKMIQDYPIKNNMINKLGQKYFKSNQKVVWLYYLMCDVMDYVTNYKICHAICNQKQTTIGQ